MGILTQTIDESNSDSHKQRSGLNKVRLDIHTLQMHSTHQAQKIYRMQTLQIELQQAVEELKWLPGALIELEAEQARLYELS